MINCSSHVVSFSSLKRMKHNAAACDVRPILKHISDSEMEIKPFVSRCKSLIIIIIGIINYHAFFYLIAFLIYLNN